MSNFIELFKNNNKNKFEKLDLTGHNRGIILVELTSMCSSHIAFSYVANSLAKIFNSDIFGYENSSNLFLENFKRRVKKIIDWREYGVYKSFNVSKFISIKAKKRSKEALRKYEIIMAALNSKRDVEAISIAGILIGDLIYDTYLKNYQSVTLEINNKNFKTFLMNFIERFEFWLDIFDQHTIKAIVLSHTSYDGAIPLRIAVARKIKCYQVNITHIYSLDEKNLFAYNDTHYYRENFLKLPASERENALRMSESILKNKILNPGYELNSKEDIGLEISDETTDSSSFQIPVSNKIKVLIATHCFFDSPHCYGNTNFPDFFEWLEYLGLASEKLDYEWFIKLHPHSCAQDIEFINDYVMRYRNITLLDKSIRHIDLIKSGIDFVLTVQGTIAYEYAAFDVKVINASLTNPHIAYNFNVHSKDILDYDRLISNLSCIKLNIQKEEVFEYFYMHELHNTENIFFPNFENTLREIGGYYEQFTPKIYEAWRQNLTYETHVDIVKNINQFIVSNDFRFNTAFRLS